MSGTTRSFSDLFGLLGGRRRSEGAAAGTGKVLPQEPLHPTKALGKFLKHLESRDNPAILDLGPVVGNNVTFFGEQLGCRIRVEDVVADIDRHVKTETADQLPRFFSTRFKQEPETVDGILCWDIFDYLERGAATALAGSLTRLLRPDGTLLGFFNTTEGKADVYTKYVVVDETNLRYRTYPATRPRQRALLNRDIIRLFEGLRVTDSFLLKSHLREILFRKPAYPTR